MFLHLALCTFPHPLGVFFFDEKKTGEASSEEEPDGWGWYLYMMMDGIFMVIVGSSQSPYLALLGLQMASNLHG